MEDDKKQLCRSTSDKKLAGVCAGVAKYFSIDPLIVRIAWFIVTWFYGIGLILYIVLAILLPEDSAAEKQEVAGTDITASGEAPIEAEAVVVEPKAEVEMAPAEEEKPEEPAEAAPEEAAE